jgi:hypothetical protein
MREQSAKFREALTKDSFPPLIPGYFLKDAWDCKNNAGPSSFKNIAAKGCKPGAKYTPRSPLPPSYSWNETSTRAKDWLPVSKKEEDVFWWRLGAGFRAQYGTSWEVNGKVDGMAPRDGAFGATRMGVEERVNSWLASLCKNSVAPPDTIEFINAYGKVDKMYQLPKKTKTPQRVSRKSSPPPPSPPKTFRTSSLEFPSRHPKKDVKGKGRALTSAEKDKILDQIIKISEELEKENNLFKQTVKISDEENEIISRIIDTMSEDIRHVIGKPKSSTLKLDTVINQALNNDTWFTPQKFIDNNHPVDLVQAKALPSSSNVKLLNKDKPIYRKLYVDSVIDTINREVRTAERFAKEKGKTFTVNLEKYGRVTHTLQNPVWEIPGFCYLAAINIAIDLKPRQYWPANPTMFDLSHIEHKYQKLQPFYLKEKVKNQHYTIVMKEKTPFRDCSGWTTVDILAKDPNSHMTVGGEGDKIEIKPLDGTNYQTWAPRMIAYLKYNKLWGYCNGSNERPDPIDEPVEPVPETGATEVSKSAKAAYNAAMVAYRAATVLHDKWDLADDRALGAVQLCIADKLQYLVKRTAEETWDNIKKQFDISGPAAIFVDFKWVINFRFDERKEPSVQISELNTRLNRLAANGFGLDNHLQAMIILSGLPQSWDGVQGSVLTNTQMKTEYCYNYAYYSGRMA